MLSTRMPLFCQTWTNFFQNWTTSCGEKAHIQVPDPRRPAFWSRIVDCAATGKGPRKGAVERGVVKAGPLWAIPLDNNSLAAILTSLS